MKRNKLVIIIVTIVVAVILMIGALISSNYMDENVYSTKELESIDNEYKKSDGSEKHGELSKADAKEKAGKILSEVYSVDVKTEDLRIQRNGITYQLNSIKGIDVEKSVLKYKEGDGEERFIELPWWEVAKEESEEEAEKKLKKSMKEVNNVDLYSSDVTYKIETISSEKNKEEYKKTLKDTWTVFYSYKSETYRVELNVKSGEVLDVSLDMSDGNGMKMDLKTKKEDINEVISPLLKTMGMNTDDYEIRKFNDKFQEFIFVNKNKSDDVFTVVIDGYKRRVIRLNRNYRINVI